MTTKNNPNAGALPELNDENFESILTVVDPYEADKTYEISQNIGFSFLDFLEEENPPVVCVYKGDLHLSSLKVGYTSNDPSFHLVVEGDVIVDGDFRWHTEFNGSFLIIQGNLKAKNIFVSGCCDISVSGTVEVENAIMGSYGDDGGYFSVGGKVTAKTILNVLHYNMGFAKRPEAVIISDININHEPDFNAHEQLTEALKPEFLEKDGDADYEAIEKALEKGIPILRTEAVPPREILRRKLEEMLVHADEITSLDLSDHELQSIPEQVFRFYNLKKLNLSDNKIETLPAGIGQLKKLEELNLRGSHLKALPPEIGELKSLRLLDLRWGYSLKALPEEMGKLKNLKILKVGYLNYALPEAFTSSVPLEELYICKMEQAGADSIFKLKSLKKLETDDVAWESIGERFLNFPLLEELRIDSLGSVKDLSALPKLKHLKVLQLDGGKPSEAQPEFLNQPEIWNIPSLEELDLQRWGELTQYNSKTKEYEVTRPAFKRFPEDAFDNLPNLRKLTTGASLETLPDAFFKLKQLEEVNMEYAKLDKAMLKRIHETFPTGVKFDIRRSGHEAGNDNELVHRLVMEGAEQMSNKEHIKSIHTFENAIEACEEGNSYSEYDLLYAFYGLVCNFRRLIPALTDQKEREEAINWLIEYSRQTLEVTPHPSAIWIFTADAAFQQEVNREAANSLGWYLYERGELEAALEAIERAILCIEEKKHYYIYDTKVRILLKMGCTEEAYRIVDFVLTHYTNFADFADFKKDDDFVQWRSRNN